MMIIEDNESATRRATYLAATRCRTFGQRAPKMRDYRRSQAFLRSDLAHFR